ncbi:hypothetical protein S101189_00874 [Pediococcus acidilactici]|uniref:hypothetical protein n=1 Tax=Pediococcus acidilactici TaxID=1254 RepID=UPI0007EFC03F|nr:hypothetical protein [Pediococcus acidilactici]ARW24310.1 hypothetical protein S100424_00874 [Pediococcus acidilactici]ARW26344.1 hypothetical protein S100313_00909 [Pediococcus acidilactici]ARW28428.1 hypothetical protein S101189_00874 [Pediococcus acidilactici]OBR26035.1 hypothetical protein SRCM100320_01826 [Pediococcus acidilactici]QHM53317.1 hypothetical protein C7M42_00008 [Pediococcus acidilactici]
MLIRLDSNLDSLLNDANTLIDVINKYYGTDLKHVVKADVSADTFNRNYRIQLLKRYKNVVKDISDFVHALADIDLNKTIEGTILNCPISVEAEGLSFDSIKKFIADQEQVISQTLELANQILKEQGLIDEEGNNDD